jgi:hypothetical protein
MLGAMPRTPRTLAIAGALLGALLIPVPPATGQVEGLEIEVRGQPVFHRANDDLGLRVRITNTGSLDLEGFTIEVGAGGKITTRSQLKSVFEADTVETIGSFAVPFEDSTLAADSSMEVTLDAPIRSLQGISLSEQEGVYPVQVQLKDPDAVPLATAVTTVLYYPDSPEIRLKVVPVLPLHDDPARDASGVFAADEFGAHPLEDALRPDGWLRRYLGEMDSLSAESFNFGVAPTPRLLEEVADMADGYERRTGDEIGEVAADSAPARAAGEWLDRLRTMTDRLSVQTMLVPYSFADLPSLAGGGGEVGAQLRAGADVLEGVLGSAAVGGDAQWLMPPGGRVDEATYDELPIGVEHIMFSFDALTPLPSPEVSGCPEAQFSFTCPVRVETPVTGPTTGFVFDAAIQQRLAALVRPGNTRMDLQEFFAETAMIREELPGRSDRVIAVSVPATWQPRPATARTFLRGMARAPWLETMTPSAALAGAGDARRRSVTRDIGKSAGQPDDSFFDQIRFAGTAVEQYRSMNPPGDIVERMTRNILVAQSRSFWPEVDGGLAYADLTRGEIDGEFGKIQIAGPQEITLTSKTGQIQVLIVNETGYDVDLNVLVTSENLTLRGEGFSREDIVEEQHIGSEQERITFNVTTRASGIFLVEVGLETPDGLDIGEPVPITVRSTAFNEIALGLTFGALAFLILFYVVRALRNRREADTGEEPQRPDA